MEKSNEKFAEFRQYLEKYKPLIGRSLRENLPPAPLQIEEQFEEALDHALKLDDQHIFFILTLLGAELFEGDPEDVLPAATAVEYAYISSMILGDLPCFDNFGNDFEVESVDQKYGEGLAVLAGIGLLNAGYPLVLVNHSDLPELAFAAQSEIVECVGSSGLVAGQTLILKNKTGESKDLKVDGTEKLRNPAFIRLALRLGAILSAANYIELAAVTRFAELLGVAYQLSDRFKRNKGVEITENNQLNSTIEEAKRVLIENFPSNDARSCLIQFTEYLGG